MKRKKKKGKWDQEENGQFMAGVVALGWGDWAGIAKFYVPSRNPKQVASKANEMKEKEQEKLKQRAAAAKKEREAAAGCVCGGSKEDGCPTGK